MVGRAQELASIRELILEQGVRLLTLTGTGGIGKTRLAVEASAAARSGFPDGVCFVPLEETRDAALVSTLLARALHVNPAHEPFSGLVAAICSIFWDMSSPYWFSNF